MRFIRVGDHLVNAERILWFKEFEDADGNPLTEVYLDSGSDLTVDDHCGDELADKCERSER